MPDLPARPASGPGLPRTYEEFLEDIKGRIRSAQARAARAIDAELIKVYWQIGYEILRRQAEEGDRRGRGGPKIVERLSADLRSAFPGARGFSVRSLRYMRAFAAAWPEREMLQSDIAALPWAHVTLLLDKLSDRPTRDWYAARASSWSKAELAHHIASRLHERQAAAITNFERTLPDGDAETVQRIALASPLPASRSYSQLLRGLGPCGRGWVRTSARPRPHSLRMTPPMGWSMVVLAAVAVKRRPESVALADRFSVNASVSGRMSREGGSSLLGAAVFRHGGAVVRRDRWV